MVFNRGEFAGLTVESAADSQRQLAKFESRENDRRSRDLWWEKSNVWAFRSGIILAAGAVSVGGHHHSVKRAYLLRRQRCPDRSRCLGKQPLSPRTPESRLPRCRTPSRS